MAAIQGLSAIELAKAYNGRPAVDKISFEAPAGQTTAILGPSGGGKSTLLALIAGLEAPDMGDVLWEGASILKTPPHRRGFGLMFQDFALFPHMNVYDNVAFGLRMEKASTEATRKRVGEMLTLVGLSGKEDRDVNTLSGGEQQRVALARSLAPQPRLLMLDEPLGALDRNLREQLMVELRDILHGMEQTALYVTHDQEEAFTLADQVILLDAGRLIQSGTPEELYRKPDSVFVARFLGLNNLIPGQISIDDGRTIVATALGSFPVPTELRGTVTALLRPDSVSLGNEGPARLEGKLLQSTFLGNMERIRIEASGQELQFDLPSQSRLPSQGRTIRLSFDPAQAVQVLPISS